MEIILMILIYFVSVSVTLSIAFICYAVAIRLYFWVAEKIREGFWW